jgi:hypothetical protein
MGTPSTGQRVHHNEPVEPLVVKPRKAEQLLDVSHSKLYELINAGELESFKDGASRKITMESIKRRIARQLQTVLDAG